MDENVLTQENEAIRAFFSQWHSYKRAVEFNYLHHREAYAALQEKLMKRCEPFSILDLASGDSSNTVGALEGTRVSSYTGVDFSKPALELARAQIAKLPCPATLVEENFVSFIDKTVEQWDVIFIGLSYHHLAGAEKDAFAAKVRKRLKTGGAWMYFEPIFQGEESREAYIERWGAHMRANWTENTPAEQDSFYAHVRQYDYPEKLEDFERITREAGFSGFEMLYCDPDGFYAIMSGEMG